MSNSGWVAVLALWGLIVVPVLGSLALVLLCVTVCRGWRAGRKAEPIPWARERGVPD